MFETAKKVINDSLTWLGQQNFKSRVTMFAELGVGTQSPSVPVHVVSTSSGSASTALELQNAATATSTAVQLDMSAHTSAITHRIAGIYDGTDYELAFSIFPAGGPLTERIRVSGAGSVVLNAKQTALATDATEGFVYIPTCAGTPTGTPVTYAGNVPLVYDSDGDVLYVYYGGWRALHAVPSHSASLSPSASPSPSPSASPTSSASASPSVSPSPSPSEGA